MTTQPHHQKTRGSSQLSAQQPLRNQRVTLQPLSRDSSDQLRREAAAVDAVDQQLLDRLVGIAGSKQAAPTSDAWGPWVTSPSPPLCEDGVTPLTNHVATSRAGATNSSPYTPSQEMESTTSTSSAVQLVNPRSAVDPSSAESHSDSSPCNVNSPSGSASPTPLKLPPPPPYTCRRRLPLPPHSSENDLLSAFSSTASSPAMTKSKVLNR